ncbi:hypothetical protein SN15_10935, partial [Stenotrophomonas maltophilia]
MGVRGRACVRRIDDPEAASDAVGEVGSSLLPHHRQRNCDPFATLLAVDQGELGLGRAVGLGGG